MFKRCCGVDAPANRLAAPKGHHFVPRLHLQHFAGSQPPGQVWTYNKKTAAVWSAIPEETAKQTNFYSFKKEDGGFDTRVEDTLVH
jgi:hypothetical protein